MKVYLAIVGDDYKAVFDNLLAAQKCAELHSGRSKRVEVVEVKSEPPQDQHDEVGHGYIEMYMKHHFGRNWFKV